MLAFNDCSAPPLSSIHLFNQFLSFNLGANEKSVKKCPPDTAMHPYFRQIQAVQGPRAFLASCFFELCAFCVPAFVFSLNPGH